MFLIIVDDNVLITEVERDGIKNYFWVAVIDVCAYPLSMVIKGK